MNNPIDRLDEAVAGCTFDRTVCIPVRYITEALEQHAELEELMDWCKAFVPDELLDPSASSIDYAVVLLRRAAEALEDVPAALRSPPPLLFTNAPRLSAGLLRDEADAIARRLDEIRSADARSAHP